MAFVFNSTAGDAAANSFVSVDYADMYFSVHLDGAFWTVTTNQKQAALVMATDRLNVEMYGGQRASTTQALSWPRSYIESIDSPAYGYISSTTIPAPLEKATCEMALHYLKVAAGEFSMDDRDLETLSSYKVGPMDFGVKAGFKADSLPQKVQNLLSSIGTAAWKASGEKPLTFVR